MREKLPLEMAIWYRIGEVSGSSPENEHVPGLKFGFSNWVPWRTFHGNQGVNLAIEMDGGGLVAIPGYLVSYMIQRNQVRILLQEK